MTTCNTRPHLWLCLQWEGAWWLGGRPESAPHPHHHVHGEVQAGHHQWHEQEKVTNASRWISVYWRLHNLEKGLQLLHYLHRRLNSVATKPKEHDQVCLPRHILPHQEQEQRHHTGYIWWEEAAPHGIKNLRIINPCCIFNIFPVTAGPGAVRLLQVQSWPPANLQIHPHLVQCGAADGRVRHHHPRLPGAAAHLRGGSVKSSCRHVFIMFQYIRLTSLLDPGRESLWVLSCWQVKCGTTRRSGMWTIVRYWRIWQWRTCKSQLVVCQNSEQV